MRNVGHSDTGSAGVAALVADPAPRRFTRAEYYKMKEAGFFPPHTVELIGGEVILKSPPADEPQPRRWTREEYYKMADLGIFEGQRVELIGGGIFIMSPQRPAHFGAIDRIAEILKNTFKDGYWIRTQGPLALRMDAEPEPDIAVVSGCREDYKEHPNTALLVVEVSLSTLEDDRTVKASLYASCNIADYWIVNLRDEQIEIFRTPIVDASALFGYAYGSKATLKAGQQISPQAKPDSMIKVADMLPSR
jgi:Uma2 family endonuclease